MSHAGETAGGPESSCDPNAISPQTVSQPTFLIDGTSPKWGTYRMSLKRLRKESIDCALCPDQLSTSARAQ